MPQAIRTCVRWHVCLLLAPLLGNLAGMAFAQEGERFFELEPYDQITLTAPQGGGVFKIVALENRKVSRPADDAGQLRVRLLDRPEHQFDVAWRDIEKIELFEDLALVETEKLIAASKFDEAYDYLAYCLRSHPRAAVVQAMRDRYLYFNAARYFQEKRFEQALGLLEDLYRANPRFKQGERELMGVLGAAADRLLETRFAAGDYLANRRLLTRLESTYGESLKSLTEKWRTRLDETASKRLVAAREYFAAGKYRESHDAMQATLSISASVAGASSLAQEIAARFPVVVVGVAQPLPKQQAASLNAWGAARAHRATRRTLVEFVGFGPDGAQFVSPWGEFAQNDDRTGLTFHLGTEQAAHFSAFDVSRVLLEGAQPKSPSYDPLWASLAGNITVSSPQTLRIDLRRGVLFAEAWLPRGATEFSVDGDSNGSENESRALLAKLDVPYVRENMASDGARFTLNEGYAWITANMPRVIEERLFTHSQEGWKALKRGEIDVLDQIFPADVAMAQNERGLKIEAFATPTLHFLIPNYGRARCANRSFRRAIEYAIDREAILSQVLLGGRTLEGCRTISGPFSPGIRENDAAGYAYQKKIEPRRFEPRLAIALAQLGAKELSQEEDRLGKPARPDKKWLLVHPIGETPRLASLAISRQLQAIGMACEIRELGIGETLEPNGNWDLAYYAMPAGEPLVDAMKLFGPQGLARTPDAYLNLTLRRWFECRRLDDAREQARRLHQQVADDVTLIPLWQLVEHFAYRSRIEGIGPLPTSLYSRVEQWHVSPEMGDERQR